MKNLVCLVIVSLLGTLHLTAQNAETLVAEGRALWTAGDLTNANSKFELAVAVEPGHETANALHALSRLAVLPIQSEGDEFLTRLGMSRTNRNIFDWTDWFSEDDERTMIAPAGVDASEITAFLRTTALTQVTGAAFNLSKIVNTNFLLTLTDAETRRGPVTMDYGDLQLIRSFLHLAEYAIYTLNAHDFNVQLATLRACYINGELSMSRLLELHPQLLTYATPSDLNHAQGAFINMVQHYGEASMFIRQRPFGTERLFEFADFTEEQDFRMTLEDLRVSLNGAVVLRTDTNYTVYLPSHFNGQHSVRTLLPRFSDGSIVLGTLDPTLGSAVYGPLIEWLEPVVHEFLGSVPGLGPISRSGQRVQFLIHLVIGRGYVIQSSFDLVNWTDVSAFVADSATINIVDEVDSGLRFYRVVDATEDMPPPANDHFVNRETITGLGVSTKGYHKSATPEPNEPFGLSIWYTWTAPVSGPVVFFDSTGNSFIEVFTGDSLASLNSVGAGYTAAWFNATAGVTYQIRLTGWGDLRLVTLHVGRPPTITITAPADEAVLSAPANVALSADVVAGDFPMSNVTFHIYTGQWQTFTFTGAGTHSAIITNMQPGWYYFSAQVWDTAGLSDWDYRQFRVAPKNDNFADYTVLLGSNSVVNGTTAGASREISEPDHSDGYEDGGVSVWYRWTRSTPHGVTLVVRNTNNYSAPIMAVYRGTALSNLTRVTNSSMDYLHDTAQLSFPTEAGAVYKIAVDSEYGIGQGFELKMHPTLAPVVTLDSPTNGMNLIVGNDVLIQATANDPDGTITNVQMFVDNELLATFIGEPYQAYWTNMSLGGHWIHIVATDDFGVSSTVSRFVSVNYPPPPNDDFSNAFVLSNSVTVYGSNVGATHEPGEPDHAYAGQYNSVWWTWTSSESGVVRISTAGSDFDTVLAVYTGDSVSTLALVASNDDSGGYISAVTFFATAGVTYRVAVDGYWGGTGNIGLRADLLVPPANDDFANATVITNTGTFFGSNDGATVEQDEPWQGDASVWWRWTASMDGDATFSTAGSNFDTVLEVYAGSSLIDLTVVAENNNYEDYTSQVTFPASAGVTYYIRVVGYYSSFGDITLNLAFAPAIWVPINAKDIDSDGHVDIIWKKHLSLSAILLDGTNVVGSAPLPSAPPSATFTDIEDINGDSTNDFVWVQWDQSLLGWMMDGTNIVQSEFLCNGSTLSWGWRGVGVADLDGDGNSDFISQSSSGRLAVWYMSGTTFIGAMNLRGGYAPGSAWIAEALGDFNGDNSADVLFQNENGQMVVWLMNNSSFMSEAMVRGGIAPPAGYRVAAVADFNDDGKNDILFHAGESPLLLWLMDGTSLISEQKLPFLDFAPGAP